MNSRPILRPVFAVLFLAFTGALFAEERVALHSEGNTRHDSMIGRDLVQSALLFVENRGQFDPKAHFVLPGRNISTFFTEKGLTLVLADAEDMDGSDHREFARVSQRQLRHWAVNLDFVGARPTRPRAENPATTTISTFKGPRSEWKTGLRTYRTVGYQELWPGIDLVFSVEANRLKHSFIVRPGADPNRIRLAINGARSVEIGAGGELRVVTPVAEFTDGRPIAFQESHSGPLKVDVAFELGAMSSDGSLEYGFRVGEFFADRTLVIDPEMIVYSGFIGGSSEDYGHGIAVDSLGRAYVAGYTSSDETSFPTEVGPILTSSGGSDAFVARIAADGIGLDWVGFIGGDEDDFVRGLALDGNSDVLVVGSTKSTELTFPVIAGPDLTHNGSSAGDSDAFIVKVKSDGSGLHYSGYIGGTENDYAYDVAVDSDGYAYVTGGTYSSQGSFPEKVGPDLTFNGIADAYVAKIAPDGLSFVFVGYIGGSGAEIAWGVAVDSSGAAYIAGNTGSSEESFPVKDGPDLTFNDLHQDTFIAKVNPDGTSLDYCGYIGGSNEERATGVAVDASGNAYIVGDTLSDEASFPVKVGPDLSYNEGFGAKGDPFIAKVASDGTELVYCGYIGGDTSGWYGYERAFDVAVDREGRAHIAGYTSATESTFPVKVGPDLTFNGNYTDGFVARVKADGTELEYCGYFGSDGGIHEIIRAIAIDDFGDVYITGQAPVNATTFPEIVGPDLTANGGAYDAFVAKISICDQQLALSAGQWKLISLPCAPGGTVTELFGGDGLGDYGVNWAMIERDETNDTYHQLEVTDNVVQGAGYWIKVLSGTPEITVNGVNTNRYTDFDIELVGDAVGSGRANLVGHPFTSDVAWGDVEVVDGASVVAISDTASGAYISARTMWTYDAGYTAHNPDSPINTGTLTTFEGFWVKALADVDLRIPSTPPALPAKRQVKTSAIGSENWWVQIGVAAEADGIEDAGNGFGQLVGSSDGYDEQDLEELEPMGAPYLTLVFPHDEWGLPIWSYTTDFRESKSDTGGRWNMEIRSDTTREVTLSWSVGGTAGDVLARSALINEETGEVVDPLSVPSYTTFLAGTEHSLTWRVNTLPALSGSTVSTSTIGSPVVLSANISDADGDDSHTATVDWGDGSSGPAVVDEINHTLSAQHRFYEAGEKTVTVCVEDAWGGQDCKSVTAIVEANLNWIFGDDFETGGEERWSDVN